MWFKLQRKLLGSSLDQLRVLLQFAGHRHINEFVANRHHHSSNKCRVNLAVTTSHTTSPLWAAIIVSKELTTASAALNLLFSAKVKKRFLDNSFIFNLSQAEAKPSAFNPLLMEGSAKKSANLWSFFKVAWNVLRSFSTTSKDFFLEAAEKSAVA